MKKNASPKNYYLVGCINRIIKNGKETFIYFSRDPYNMNIWHKDEEILTINNVPINDIMKRGQIIMLFYKSDETG